MNEQILRRAVELADGWTDAGDGNFWLTITTDDGHQINILGAAFSKPCHPALDALAAQLTRQVDETLYSVHIMPSYTSIHQEQRGAFKMIASAQKSDNRTENTITAIVAFADKHPEVFSGGGRDSECR